MLLPDIPVITERKDMIYFLIINVLCRFLTKLFLPDKCSVFKIQICKPILQPRLWFEVLDTQFVL